jgi:hypothetical protein
MTPIKAMAKAGWNATADEFNQWEQLDAEEQILAMDGMRAALLALSEIELDDMMIDHAPGMDWGDKGDAIVKAANNFRCLCRALAERT